VEGPKKKKKLYPRVGLINKEVPTVYATSSVSERLIFMSDRLSAQQGHRGV